MRFEKIEERDQRARNLMVSDLYLETKGFFVRVRSLAMSRSEFFAVITKLMLKCL